jgi:hypothetical protein
MQAPVIYTPHALPMFKDQERDGLAGGGKRKRERERNDPVKTRKPTEPISGPGKGGRVGASELHSSLFPSSFSVILCTTLGFRSNNSPTRSSAFFPFSSSLSSLPSSTRCDPASPTWRHQRQLASRRPPRGAAQVRRRGRDEPRLGGLLGEPAESFPDHRRRNRNEGRGQEVEAPPHLRSLPCSASCPRSACYLIGVRLLAPCMSLVRGNEGLQVIRIVQHSDFSRQTRKRKQSAIPFLSSF